jgi:hypothetical protein
MLQNQKQHPLHKAQTPRNDINYPSLPTSKAHTIFTRMCDVKDGDALRKIYTNQTGRNQYVIVLVVLDSGSNLIKAMQECTSGKMIHAYQHMVVNHLKESGMRPKHHVLNNECFGDFKLAIKNSAMTYQLIPPNNHHHNIAKKAIQTFKAHFISILCGIDKSFPLQLWCQLLRQAKHTLNILRPLRMMPTILAYNHMWGQYVNNANPFAPLGCKVEAYLYPSIWETWAPHSAGGYYIGNLFKHYQCHEV